jgi:DNA-binding phage protein
MTTWATLSTLGMDYPSCDGRMASGFTLRGLANGLFCSFTAEEKMPKKATSKKRELSLNDIPIRRLKAGAGTVKTSSAKRLQDQELVFRAFWQCLIDKDIESFKDILRGHLDAVNKGSLAKRSKTSRRTLHRILSPEGNPTLKSISNVIHALYG